MTCEFEYVRPVLSSWTSTLLLLIAVMAGVGNTKAASLPVLPPWTPIQYHAGILRVWGQEYGFRHTILPKTIVTHGKSILGGPIRLICRSGGKTLVAHEGAVVTRSAGPAEVDLSSGVSFNRNIQAAVALHVEYDGLMVYRVALTSRHRITVDELSLEIPIKASVASYFQNYILMNADWGKQATHAIPEGEGVVWQSPFNPYIWIGNESEGLFWFSQSNADWSNRSAPLRLIREGSVVTLVISFINDPTKISTALHFDFGLQATPTRPLPAHWRSIRQIRTWPLRDGLSPSNPRPRYVILWPNRKDWKYFGFPEPKNAVQMHALIRSLHAKGIKVLVYVQAEAMAANVPGYTKRIAAWQYIPEVVDRSSSDVVAMGAPIHAVNPASGWAKVFLDQLRSFLNTYNVDGLYLDNIYIYPDRNRQQYRKGTVYPILALRALVRNIYSMVKAKDLRNLVIIHMSAHDLVPVISYSDVILDGEDIASRPWTCKTYWKMLNLEEFRGEIYGRQWGPAPMFLSTLGYKKGCLDTYRPSEYVLAYALVHGNLLWGQFKDDILSRVYRIYDAFGVDNATFVPYWESSKFLRMPVNGESGSGIKMSLYISDEEGRRCLLVVSNLDAIEQTVDVGLKLRRLNIATPHQASVWSIDGTTHESTVPLRGDRIKISVPGYDFRLVGIN